MGKIIRFVWARIGDAFNVMSLWGLVPKTVASVIIATAGGYLLWLKNQPLWAVYMGGVLTLLSVFVMITLLASSLRARKSLDAVKDEKIGSVIGNPSPFILNKGTTVIGRADIAHDGTFADNQGHLEVGTLKLRGQPHYHAHAESGGIAIGHNEGTVNFAHPIPNLTKSMSDRLIRELESLPDIPIHIMGRTTIHTVRMMDAVRDFLVSLGKEIASNEMGMGSTPPRKVLAVHTGDHITIYVDASAPND